MKVLVACDIASARPSVRRLTAAARSYLRALGRQDAELSLAIVGDRRIRTLNREWRRKDRATW